MVDMPRPAPGSLWRQAEDERAAAGESPTWRTTRYRELMREHGHLVTGRPRRLACGWPR